MSEVEKMKRKNIFFRFYQEKVLEEEEEPLAGRGKKSKEEKEKSGTAKKL